MSALYERIASLRLRGELPCEPALVWLRARPAGEAPAETYLACAEGSWLLWLIEAVGGDVRQMGYACAERARESLRVASESRQRAEAEASVAGMLVLIAHAAGRARTAADLSCLAAVDHDAAATARHAATAATWASLVEDIVADVGVVRTVADKARAGLLSSDQERVALEEVSARQAWAGSLAFEARAGNGSAAELSAIADLVRAEWAWSRVAALLGVDP